MRLGESRPALAPTRDLCSPLCSAPFYTNGCILRGSTTVSAVEMFRFLGSTPNMDTIIKQAQQSTYFQRQVRKFKLPQELLTKFHAAIIQSVLCSHVLFRSAIKQDRLHSTIHSEDCREDHRCQPALHSGHTSLGTGKGQEKIPADPSALKQAVPTSPLCQVLQNTARQNTHKNAFSL